jgi:hypothetical protein
LAISSVPRWVRTMRRISSLSPWLVAMVWWWWCLIPWCIRGPREKQCSGRANLYMEYVRLYVNPPRGLTVGMTPVNPGASNRIPPTPYSSFSSLLMVIGHVGSYDYYVSIQSRLLQNHIIPREMLYCSRCIWVYVR